MSIVNPTQEQLKVLKDHYEDIILSWPEGYDFCEVCLIKEGMQQDDLIFCELCNGLIHQSCYGSELLESIPENDWYCERCREYIKDYVNAQKLHDKTAFKCFFCPEQKGIVKKITIQQSGTQIWSHVGCVASIKSLNFVDTTRTLIVQKYTPKNTTNECKICGLITGNCGYCHTTGCNFTFHFSCGKREGIIQDVTLMNTLMECREKQYKNSEPEHHVIFCEEHLYQLSYVEYPEDIFLKEFIDNMYIQRQTFQEEQENLSCLLDEPKKCQIITYDKKKLLEKYQTLGDQKKSLLRKSKRGSQSSLPQSKQSLSNINKDRSRSRSRSPPKSDKKTGGKKLKGSSSQLQIESEKEISKKQQKTKSNISSQTVSASKITTNKGTVEKDELIKQQSFNNQTHSSTTGNKTKPSTTPPALPNEKNPKSKQTIVVSTLPIQQQKIEQQDNSQASISQQQQQQQLQTQTQTQKKGQGKRGQKNEDESNAQLLENQDNWRRIQKVMQTFDYRDKVNNVEEQKLNEDGFYTPFSILKELTEILPKRATLETTHLDQQQQQQNIDQVVERNIDENKVCNSVCDESSDPNKESSNMQMIELDSTVLDQDKIIEEQKQSELQSCLVYQDNRTQGKKPLAKEIEIDLNTSNKSELNKKNAIEIEEEQDLDDMKNQKILKAKTNKLSDDEKKQVYKRFIIEYVKQNRSKLNGPHSLYIIHPEMMQIMDIKSALPQRKMKKEIAHYFVQKECLNPIQKEVQITKCINQRIIDIFLDHNIPSNIPSKNFYKIFKTNFLIKVYDTTNQLSEFLDNSENTELVQPPKDSSNNNQAPQIINTTLIQSNPTSLNQQTSLNESSQLNQDISLNPQFQLKSQPIESSIQENEDIKNNEIQQKQSIKLQKQQEEEDKLKQIQNEEKDKMNDDDIKQSSIQVEEQINDKEKDQPVEEQNIQEQKNSDNLVEQSAQINEKEQSVEKNQSTEQLSILENNIQQEKDILSENQTPTHQVTQDQMQLEEQKPQTQTIEQPHTINDSSIQNQPISNNLNNLGLDNQNIEEEKQNIIIQGEDIQVENKDIKKQTGDIEAENKDIQHENKDIEVENKDIQVEGKEIEAENKDIQVECKDIQKQSEEEIQVEGKEIQVENQDIQVECEKDELVDKKIENQNQNVDSAIECENLAIQNENTSIEEKQNVIENNNQDTEKQTL